ncbi:MAG: FitA-like ribbon-helix-helix domain-containing protein [Casimicrobium sp.]
MRTLVIRKVPEEVYLSIVARSKANQRSIESELRAIIRDTTQPQCLIGEELLRLGATCIGLNLELKRGQTGDASWES